MRVDGPHDLVVVVAYALYLLVKLIQTGHISAQSRVDTHYAKLFGEDSFDDKPAAVVFQSGLRKHPAEADILLLIEPERVLVTDFSLFVLFFHLLRFKGGATRERHLASQSEDLCRTNTGLSDKGTPCYRPATVNASRRRRVRTMVRTPRPAVLPGLQYYNAFRLITSRSIGLERPPCDIRRKPPKGYYLRAANDFRQ